MAQRTLIWSSGARGDLREIGEYIARDKPIAANRWVQVLLMAAEQAAALPFAGRCVPEYDREDVREVLRRGYRVVYRVTDEQVEILAVFEGHRQMRLDLLDG